MLLAVTKNNTSKTKPVAEETVTAQPILSREFVEKCYCLIIDNSFYCIYQNKSRTWFPARA